MICLDRLVFVVKNIGLKIHYRYLYYKMFCEILKKYENINTSYGTDKNTVHSYGGVYENLFSTYQKGASKILEIGFDSGASLQAYSDYFENASIYGIDINDNCAEVYKKNPKINIYIGDATKENTIRQFPYEYDIIVEDASHLPEHQIRHFQDYCKFVKKEGLYIIEDVHENYFELVKNETRKIGENNGFTMEVFDLRPMKNRFDDILIVFKKN